MQIPGVTGLLPDSDARHLNQTSLLNQSQRLEAAPITADATGQHDPALREAFHDFVGQTFFSELIKSYRSTQQPSAYFHGGRAEQIFQGQLDQVLTESLSERTAQTIADPMFELFMAKRV